MAQLTTITLTSADNGTTKKVRAGDAQYVSTCEVQVSGLVGSMTPQTRIALDGDQSVTAPFYDDCAYTNARTGASYTAGTAITADGTYTFDTTGQQLAMEVTSITGTCTLYVTQRLGSAAGAGDSSSGGAVTIDDGADVALGATTDAAVTTNTTGTVSGKLRGLVAILADVWVSASHYLKVRVTDGTNNLPTGDAAARGIYTTITDLTNTAAVKAASTAVAASDPALAVSISPNSVAPVKQNPASATVNQVAMSTSATSIVASNSTRSGLVIKNIDSSIAVYIGTSNSVTSSNGYALAAGESVALSITTNQWYGIAASGTPRVAYIEV